VITNNYFSIANALSSTSDFSTPGDYTLSDTNGSEITGWVWRLNKRFEHIGFIRDNTDLNALQDITVDWSYAYVASNANTTDRVTVVDISDPTSPFVEAVVLDNVGWALLNWVNNIQKIWNYIYASATTDDAIQVIDVTDPTNPVVGAQILDVPTSREIDGPRWWAVVWDYFYIATQVGRAVVTIDISNPATPVYVDTDREAENLRWARDLTISWDHIIATAYNRDRVTSLDISTADNPVFDDTIQDTTFFNGDWHISASGSYAYVSSNINDSVEVVDISDPSNLSRVTSIPNWWSFLLDQPRGSTIVWDTLFVTANTSDAVNAIDISNPLAPTFIESITDTSGWAQEINGARAITNVWNRLYIAAWAEDAIEILDFDYNNTSPTITPNTAFNFTGEELSSFTETLWANNEWTVTYQISRNNGTDWYYYNGTTWTLTTWWVAESNSATVVNANINTFNWVGSGNDFLWRAYLTSDGDQRVEIDEISVVSFPPADPAPGWVDVNLALWLKADEGTSTIIDGTALTTWSDQSWNGLDAAAVNAPTYRNNASDELNYNPVIDFDGVNDYMRNLVNGAHSDTYYLVIVPDVDVEWTSSQWVPFSFDCQDWILSAWGPCGLPFGGIALGAFTLSIPDEVITHAIGSSANYRSSKTAVVTYPAGKPLLIGVNDNSGSSITNIYEKWEQIDNAVRNSYQTVSSTDYGLWRSMDNANPFPFDWKIAEVINYDGWLTTLERQKIESYLAIKYGITLNSGTQDYVASDGTTIFWNTVTNTWYNNNIFWIGRDNAQELWQVQSKSINDGGVVTVEARWEWTNISNSFVDISDREFFMSWDNLGWNSWSAVDAPAWYNILDRKWKAQETGDVWNIRVSFDVDDTNFDVPSLTAGTDYFFVFDSDWDGNLSDEIPSSMTNVSGSIWESTDVNIDNGQVYTIATLASLNNIPTDIDISSSNINENVANGTTLGTLSTTDADPLDTHSYSLVSGSWDDDNDRFVIAWSSLNFNHSPDHEIQDTYSVRIQTDDGNGWIYQEVFIITINDIGEAITSTIDLENIEDEDKYTVGSGQWNNNTVNPNAGTNALESNNLWVNNTQSCFQIEHNSATDWFVEFEYSVSSDTGDELVFYIDNVQQNQWSGIIPYATYTSSVQSAGPHTYKWCYIKDGAWSAGTDNAYIDDINFINGASDTTPPTIDSTNFASGSLLPGGNHDIIITYSDADSWIDSASTIMQLYKWDWVSAYGPNIAGTGITFNSASTSTASYSTNNLSFGRYQYRFSISDNAGNPIVYIHDFYIDEPEFTISTSEIDVGTLTTWTGIFSPSVTITVRTVGAAFDVTMNRSSSLSEGIENIPSYNGTIGYGYQQVPWTISEIWINENIATQTASIDTNGFKNTYTYDIEIWAIIDMQQTAGDYMWNLDFSINLTY